jgi:hypothetical protein
MDLGEQVSGAIKYDRRIAHRQAIQEPKSIWIYSQPGCHHIFGTGRVVEQNTTRVEVFAWHSQKIHRKQIRTMVAPVERCVHSRWRRTVTQDFELAM